MIEILSHFVTLSLERGIRTFSPVILNNARLVCKAWKSIADSMRWDSLIATPLFLRLKHSGALPWYLIPRFYATVTSGMSQKDVFDTISFHYHWHMNSNLVMVRKFTSVLTRCRAAQIVFDPNAQTLGVVEHEAPLIANISDAGTTYLKSFSWESSRVGIRHQLPWMYGFPWHTLKQGLPWSNLAYVRLDCPLDVRDAYFVLECGSSTLVTALLGKIFAEDQSLPNHWHPITLEFLHLESLTLSFRGFADMSCLLPHLDLSWIKHIDIAFDDNDVPRGSLLFSTGPSLTIIRSPNAITRLDLCCKLSITEAYNILSELTNVEIVKFSELSSQYFVDAIVDEPIRNLSSLSSLSVRSCVALHPLFRKLAMPKLTSLEWTVQRTVGPATGKSVLTVLSPSVEVPWDRLRSLVIRYNAEEECNLSAILVQCGQLERLTLASETNNLSFPPGIEFGKQLTHLNIGAGVSTEDVLTPLLAQQLDTMKLHQGSSLFTDSDVLLAIKHLFLDEPISLQELWCILKTDTLQDNLITGHFCIVCPNGEQQVDTGPPIVMQQLQRMKLVVTPDHSAATSIPSEFLTTAITVSRNSRPVINIHNNEVDLWYKEAPNQVVSDI